MNFTILSTVRPTDGDYSKVRVKTDDWEGELLVSGTEECIHQSLEKAVEAKLKARDWSAWAKEPVDPNAPPLTERAVIDALKFSRGRIDKPPRF